MDSTAGIHPNIAISSVNKTTRLHHNSIFWRTPLIVRVTPEKYSTRGLHRHMCFWGKVPRKRHSAHYSAADVYCNDLMKWLFLKLGQTCRQTGVVYSGIGCTSRYRMYDRAIHCHQPERQWKNCIWGTRICWDAEARADNILCLNSLCTKKIGDRKHSGKGRGFLWYVCGIPHTHR